MPPPGDAVSSLSFAPTSGTKLLVSSWDKKVYFYDVASADGESNLINTFEHRAPVLDVCFGANDNEAFTAGMDWTVNRCAQGRGYSDLESGANMETRIDLQSGEKTLLSKHAAPVRCVVYSPAHCKLSFTSETRPPTKP